MHWDRVEPNNPRRSEVSSVSFEHHAGNLGAERQNAAYQARAAHENLLQESAVRRPYVQPRVAYSTSGAEYSTQQIYGTVNQPHMGRIENYNHGYGTVAAYPGWNNGGYQTWNNSPYQTWNNPYYGSGGVYSGWNNGACLNWNEGAYNCYPPAPPPCLIEPYGPGVAVYEGYPYGPRGGGAYLAGSIINLAAPLAVGLAARLLHHRQCY